VAHRDSFLPHLGQVAQLLYSAQTWYIGGEAGTVGYSRKTLGFVRDLLNQKAQALDHMTSAIVRYWKPTLFDIGVQIDVINVMSSHSFDWTNIIPTIADRRLGENNVYFSFPLSSKDQADALDLLVKLLLDSYSPHSPTGRELRELLAADGFILKDDPNPPKPKQVEPSTLSSPTPFSSPSGDAYFCRLAVDEARKSILEDDGKPMVGGGVAKDGKLLVTAHRGEIPNNHAEYIALEQKLPDAVLAGASVYTTLEPCSSRNQPKIPCAERLVRRKVGRVFIGMLDPNPDIQGDGVQILRDANIAVQFFPDDLMKELEELNRNFTRQFRDAPRAAGKSIPVIRPISQDEQKIADVLKFKGKPITVFNKQKYGHGYLEGTFDAVVVDCDSLGVVLKTPGGELSFSLNQIELSRDTDRKTLKLTVYR
jgi:pyrimidine deaminase RibD-like protein